MKKERSHTLKRRWIAGASVCLAAVCLAVLVFAGMPLGVIGGQTVAGQPGCQSVGSSVSEDGATPGAGFAASGEDLSGAGPDAVVSGLGRATGEDDTGGTAAVGEGARYRESQVLLYLDGQTSVSDLSAQLESQGVSVTGLSLVSNNLSSSLTGLTSVLVQYASGQNPEELSQFLANQGVISQAEPNYLYSLLDDEAGLQSTVNDPGSSSQWALSAIGAYDAWDKVTCSGAVTVAVIDSGVDTDHPDLANNLVLDCALNACTGITGPDAVEDVIGHGTHVAGIVSACANNGVGVAGLSYNAKVLPVKVTSDAAGHISAADVIKAIDYVVSLKQDAAASELANLRVINMSLGGANNSLGYQGAIDAAAEAGITLVAAAGNNHENQLLYPAACDNVIGVSGLKSVASASQSVASGQGSSTGQGTAAGQAASAGQGTAAGQGISASQSVTADQSTGMAFDSSYSNYGSHVDLSAPGTNIYSLDLNGGYLTRRGTSMAAPCVAAAAALLYAQDATYTPSQVESLLEDTATDLGEAGRDDYYGYGALNVDAAVGVHSCSHQWGPWETAKPATTTEEGLRQRVCALDGSHVETEAIPRLEHLLFTDVEEGSWYYDSVYNCVDRGLICGYDDGTYRFGPGDTLTRAQAAVILWRFYRPADAAAGTASAQNTTGMPDVEDGAWYTAAANWAVAAGVISGKGEGGDRVFDPEGTVTREQLCAMVANASRAFAGSVIEGANREAMDVLPDASSVSPWAEQSMAWSLDEGVIQGRDLQGRRYIEPQGDVTRAEMAAIVMNCLNRGLLGSSQ